MLEQNVPNPFADNTTINYFIPDNVKEAKIIFFDNTGRLIKEVVIEGNGQGVLNVFAPDLSNGTYSYSIIDDDKVIDTKRMVKVK